MFAQAEIPFCAPEHPGISLDALFRVTSLQGNKWSTKELLSKPAIPQAGISQISCTLSLGVTQQMQMAELGQPSAHDG